MTHRVNRFKRVQRRNRRRRRSCHSVGVFVRQFVHICNLLIVLMCYNCRILKTVDSSVFFLILVLSVSYQFSYRFTDVQIIFSPYLYLRLCKPPLSLEWLITNYQSFSPLFFLFSLSLSYSLAVSPHCSVRYVLFVRREDFPLFRTLELSIFNSQ